MFGPVQSWGDAVGAVWMVRESLRLVGTLIVQQRVVEVLAEEERLLDELEDRIGALQHTLRWAREMREKLEEKPRPDW